MISSYAQTTTRRRTVDIPPPPPTPGRNNTLVLGTGNTFFPGETALVSLLEIPTGLYAPKSVWFNGKTYYTYQARYDVSPFGQARLIIYDEVGDTFTGPINAGPIMREADTHTVPVIWVTAGFIYIYQEDLHNSAINIYRAPNSAPYTFETLSAKIGNGLSEGVGLAYSHIFALNSGLYWWGRGLGSEYSAYHVKSLDGTPDNWGFTEVRDSQSAVSPRHYENVPLNNVVNGNAYLWISERTDSGGGGWWQNHNLLVSSDMLTFRNFQNSYQRTVASQGLITNTILQDNFRVIDVGVNKQAHVPRASCISPQGDPYGIFSDGVSSYRLYYYNNGWVYNAVSTANIPNLNTVSYIPFTATNQNNPFYALFAYSDTDIQALVDQWDGSRRSLHLMKTTDKGVTWSDLGDLYPEIPGNHASFTYPENIFDIPESRKFVGFCTQWDGVSDINIRGTRAKICAFGSMP